MMVCCPTCASPRGKETVSAAQLNYIWHWSGSNPGAPKGEPLSAIAHPVICTHKLALFGWISCSGIMLCFDLTPTWGFTVPPVNVGVSNRNTQGNTHMCINIGSSQFAGGWSGFGLKYGQYLRRGFGPVFAQIWLRFMIFGTVQKNAKKNHWKPPKLPQKRDFSQRYGFLGTPKFDFRSEIFFKKIESGPHGAPLQRNFAGNQNPNFFWTFRKNFPFSPIRSGALWKHFLLCWKQVYAFSDTCVSFSSIFKLCNPNQQYMLKIK